jgi:hypothetical protein
MSSDLDDDDGNTPREHLVTAEERREHYAEYPEGTAVVSGVAGEDLLRRVRLLERHVEDQRGDVASLKGSRSLWSRVLWVAGPLMFTAMLYSADRITSSAERVGATAAKIEALDEQIKELQREVLMLLKLSGYDTKSSVTISSLSQGPQP